MAKRRDPKVKRFKNWKCGMCGYKYTSPLPLLTADHWCNAASPSKYIKLKPTGDEQ